ncbi:MAG: lactonase family protein [Erysipelotrichaceae bacterium]|nr:lactonase family protein [Erysipelotrichaceae bacterium]
MKYKGYVGTYTSKESKGIYSFEFDGKKLSNVELLANVKNPKYLTFADDLVVAVCDYEKGSGISIFDKEGNKLDSLEYEDSTSCYIDYKDGYLYTSNYHEGTFSVISIKDNKLEFVKKVLIKEKAGSHQVLFYKDEFLVPCLFLDKIAVIDENYDIVSYIEFEEGSGPRHGVFSKDGKYLYIIGELSNKLYVVDMDLRKVVNSVNVLENNKTHVKDSAAIRMSDDGKYIYVSTRTEDVISVLKVDKEDVKLVQVVSSEGLHPRDFILEKDCLIIANRSSNNLVSMSINNGLIDKVENIVDVPEGIAIILEEK